MIEKLERKRRVLVIRFSVRGLLLATLVVASVLAWWSNTVRKQHRVCKTLESFDQIVDWQFEEPSVWVNWLPASVLELYDGHLFKRVTELQINAEFENVLRIPKSLQSEIVDLPYLEEVHFNSVQFDNQDLDWLDRVSRLRAIELWQCSWLGSDPWKLPPNIQTLILYQCSDVDLLIASVGEHRSLEELEFEDCPLFSKTLDCISGCRTLKRLRFNHYANVSIAADDFVRLRELPNLEMLKIELPENSLSIESIKSISQFSRLKALAFPAQGLDDSALEQLSSVKELEEISFTNDPSSATFFENLSKLKNVRSVETNWLSQSSLRSIVVALKSVPNLERIEHTNSKLPIAGLIELARSARSFRGVEELSHPVPSDLTREKLLRLGGQVGNGAIPSSLNLANAFDTAGQWEHASLLNGLQSLTLLNTDVTDNDLLNVSRIESLEELDVSNTPITDKGVRHLTNLKNLKVLSILGCPLSPTFIPTFRRLTKIDVGQCELSTETLCAIAELPNIVEVEVMGVSFPLKAAVAFSKSRSLKILRLTDCFVDTQTMALLSGPTFAVQLVGVGVRLDESDSTQVVTNDNSVESTAVTNSTQANEIEEILLDADYSGTHNFSRVQITDEVFKPDWLLAVRRLAIHGQPITDGVVDKLLQATRIQELDITYTKITDGGIARLVKLPDLGSLAIGGSAITSGSLDSVLEMGDRLRSLEIEDVDLSIADLRKLNSCSRLDSLRLSGTNLTTEEVFQVLELPLLANLTVDGNYFDKHDLAAYRFNRVDYAVTELRLNAFPWTAERLELLRNHLGIADLNLESDSDFSRVFDVASTMPNLRNIWLFEFDKSKLLELPERLSVIPQLKLLCLRQIRVTPETLRWISYFENLEDLDLDGCTFTTQDLSALNRLSRLHSLSLESCGLGDEAIATLNSPQLENLRLRDNKLTDASIAKILSFGGIGIYVGENEFSPAGEFRVQQGSNRPNKFFIK